MAEERLIDDDKDRKYKIRINEDGEEELVIDDSVTEDEESDIPFFEVPVYDEDDEDAAVLTPEQLAERERLKKQEQEARAERVSSFCEKAKEKFAEGDFEAARYALSQAEDTDDKNGEVYCLKLKVMTKSFTEFNSLEDCAECADGVKEYADGQAKEQLRELASGLKERIGESERETLELSAKNEEGKAGRRQTFARAKSRTFTALLCTAVPFICLLIAAIVFGSMMFSKENGSFLIATIVLGALALIAFVCTLVAANKFWTAARNVKLNESDNATKIGREYLQSKTHTELLKRIYASFNDDLS